jgi:tetratricopeptide (TPR) repeat protein
MICDEMLQAENIKNEANALFKQKKYEEAILMYNKAIELNPAQATFLNNRAAAHIQNFDFTNALRDCIECLRIDPTQIKAYFRASKCLLHLGKVEDSLSHLHAAQQYCDTPANKLSIQSEVFNLFKPG